MYRGETMIDKKLYKQCLEEKYAVAEKMDVDEFRKFIKRWLEKGIFTKDVEFLSEEAIKLILCEMAWNFENVSEETKKKVNEWCNENRYGRFSSGFAYLRFKDNDREY